MSHKVSKLLGHFFSFSLYLLGLSDGQRIGSGSAVGGLYYLDVPQTSLPLVEKWTSTQAL